MSALAIVMCLFFRAHLVFLNRLDENVNGGLDIEDPVGFRLDGNGEVRGVLKACRHML